MTKLMVFNSTMRGERFFYVFYVTAYVFLLGGCANASVCDNMLNLKNHTVLLNIFKNFILKSEKYSSDQKFWQKKEQPSS
jgi:hypothetical protein